MIQNEDNIMEALRGMEYPQNIDVVDQVMCQIEQIDLHITPNPFERRARRRLWASISSIAACLVIAVSIFFSNYRASLNSDTLLSDMVSEIYISSYGLDADDIASYSVEELAYEFL